MTDKTTTTTMPPLLPCRRCGQVPYVLGAFDLGYKVACVPNECNGFTDGTWTTGRTEEEAISAWNRRAAPSPAPAAPSAAQDDDALTVLQKLVGEIDSLMDDSEGVAGLHKNGDIAPWDDLMSDGQYPWLGSLDEARAVCVRPAAPARPAQDSLTSALEFRPDLGAATLEPSLREIVHGYYAAHFRDGGSAKFADEYLDAISAARASAPAAPEVVEKPILWCVHHIGPDDLHPVESYEEAVKMADAINDQSEKFNFGHKPDSIDYVYSRAYPAPWTGTPESHAELTGWMEKRRLAALRSAGEGK